MSNITIMPGSSDQYVDTPAAISTTPSMVRFHLSELDKKQRIKKIEVFAAHANGTPTLPPDLLQTDAHLFDVWYYCTMESGKQVCIRATCESGFAEGAFVWAETSYGLERDTSYGLDRG